MTSDESGAPVATVPPLGRTLSVWLALQGLVAALIVSATVFAANTWFLHGRQSDEMQLKREVVRHALAETAGAADIGELRHKLDDFLAGHEDMTLMLSTGANRVIYDSATLRGHKPGNRLQTAQWEEAWPSGSGEVISARLSLDVGHDDKLLKSLGVTLLLASLVGAAVVSLTGYLLVRRGLRPVHRLSAQIEAIALDRPQRLDGSGQPPELMPLIERFNALLSRAERAYLRLEAFNADVAHELRTPLTTLIGASELALQRDRPAEELREVIGENLEDLRRLATVVNDMLFLSQADRGAAARRGEVPSLAKALAEVIDYHEAALYERDLAATCEGDASGAFDVSLLRRALSNLLSNATRYATSGSAIVVRIELLPGQTRLSVQNMGDPIDQDHLHRLFDRFYRAEPSRRQAGGANHGLGLAIVAAIARMHGGQPLATSENGITTIGLDLPLTSLPSR